MLIRSILDQSRVNGPGNRMVLWFQGCRLACPGCWNQETWPMTSPDAAYYSPLDLVSRIQSVRRLFAIDGVTFSGGEPMHAAYELATALELLRCEARQDISVGMYTGYTKRELDQGQYQCNIPANRTDSQLQSEKARTWRRIRQQLDFAVMGRFNQQQLDRTGPLCSSRNQELRLFSSRYGLSDFPPQQMEASITEDRVTLTGFPTGAF